MEVVTRLLHRLPVKKHHHHTLVKENKNEESRAINLISQDSWSPPWLDDSHIRLVLFHDRGDGRGKIPVFDTKQNSNSRQMQADSLSSSNKSKDDCLQSSSSLNYNHTSSLNNSRSRAQSSDSQMLGEMIFGSMPLKVIGNSVKIHYIRSQQQLLLTKIFTTSHRPLPTCRVGDFSESCPLPVDHYCMDNSLGSTSDYCSGQLRVPSLSPESDNRSRSNSFNKSYLHPCSSPSASLPVSLGSSYNHDTTASPNQSWTLGIPVPTAPPSSLNSSLTRRLHRARSTSLENATQLFNRVLRPIDQGASLVKKGRRYGIGLIFTLEDMNPNDRRLFQDFFFSHFTLISSHLEQFKEKMEEALSGRRTQAQFSERISEAYAIFVNNFVSLYCTQRIKAPVWLSVVRCSHGNRKDVCRRFLSEFVTLATELDNKDSKFFLSTILTSVLSMHLAWMFTVSKNSYTTSRHDKITSRSLAVLPETHPYNPLWAQLGDLYGAVTDPLIVTRTIVTGKNVTLIQKLLYILTYFIRCSEIEPNSELRKSVFEESDRNHESRAGSTITVTDDITSLNSNSIHSLERGTDQPLLKPHPFSFNVNSFSNSLRSLSCIDAITDIHRQPVALTTSNHSFDNDGSLSSSSTPFNGGNSDWYCNSKQQISKEKDNDWLPEDSNTNNHNTSAIDFDNPKPDQTGQTCFSFPSTSYYYPLPNDSVTDKQSPAAIYPVHNKPAHSIDSSNSSISEPATDSGQFSDLETHQKFRDCLVNKLCDQSTTLHSKKSPYNIIGSCPVTQSNTLCHNKFGCFLEEGSCSRCSPIPTIRIASSLNNTHSFHNTSSYPALPVSQNHLISTPNTGTSGYDNSRHSNSISSAINPIPNSSVMSLSVNTTTSLHLSSSSPNMLDSIKRCKNDESFTHNKSWTGLPLLEFDTNNVNNPHFNNNGGCDGGEPHFINGDDDEDEPILLKLDQVNVEESLFATSVRMMSSSPTTSKELSSKGMKYAKQFQDFTPIDISRCVIVPNQSKQQSEPSSMISSEPKSPLKSNDISLSDFGHSLMAGFSDTYLTDFVLHGTSQPIDEFKDSLISDLSSVLKNSIVDLPVQHATAIVIDTDSLSCKSFILSKSPRTLDGELSTGTLLSSNAVHEMVQSVLLLWKLQMGPEFCLSQLEDCLMELNDRSQMLSSAILEKCDSFELSPLLQNIHSTLNTHPSDQKFLQALASIHCSNSDRNISRALQTSFIQSITCVSK